MAVQTKAYTFVDGIVDPASNVNRVIDDLYDLQNGSINSANLEASGVGASNIETSAVVTRTIAECAVTSIKIGTCQVLGSNIAEGIIQYQSLDHDGTIIIQEVM